MGGEGMPKGVGTDVFGYARPLHAGFDGLVDNAGIDVVATRDARAWVYRQVSGGKQILPAPFFAGLRKFSRKCVRQVDLPVTPAQILLVEGFDFGEMILQER